MSSSLVEVMVASMASLLSQPAPVPAMPVVIITEDVAVCVYLSLEARGSVPVHPPLRAMRFHVCKGKGETPGYTPGPNFIELPSTKICLA